MATQDIKSVSRSFILAVAGWGIIATVLIASAGFYAGYNYKADQVSKTKAAVQDALKAVATPAAVVAAVPKN